MISESNFVIRTSGRKENSYYIDYIGVYKISGIAKIAGISVPDAKEIYLENGAQYDENQDVYYFDSIEKAKKAIKSILKKVNSGKLGRVIVLTDAEIEYIRQALINEGSNTIRVSNKVKDSIFKKLNL